jgi:hypothetical protein
MMNPTIPDSLIRYREALEEAIDREIASSARRHRRVLVGGASVVAGLGALSLLVSGASTSTTPAQAAVIRQAASALARTPGTILQTKYTVRQDNGNGTTSSWSQETFDEQRAPYDSVVVSVQLPGTPAGVEQATIDGVPQLYDPTRNTIYIGARARANADPAKLNRPHYQFSAGPRPGSYRVRVGFLFVYMPHGAHKPKLRRIYRTMVVTARQAQGLRRGSELVRATFHGFRPRNLRLVAAPRSSESNADDLDPFSSSFRGQILALLHSSHARVLGHAAVDGQETIKIQSADRRTTYYVAPSSYRPVELTTRGTTGGTVLRVEIYRQLPLRANSPLLSLTAQHPMAKLDRNLADYNAANRRLFPHG